MKESREPVDQREVSKRGMRICTRLSFLGGEGEILVQ